MKAIKILLTVTMLSVAAIAAAQPFEPNILLLSEQCSASVAYYPAALTARGHAFTETNNVDDFYAALTNGTEWDLVLVDEYQAAFDSPTLMAIFNFVQDGGHCIVNYWGLDATLIAPLGASMDLHDPSYDIPIPVKRWVPADPLFTTPNTIPDLTPVLDTCTVDGFYLQPNDDATAVAGYTPAAANNHAAIIIGNEGRTILLGITPGLFGPDMGKLLENCIEYVFPAAPSLRVTLNTATPAIGSPFTIYVAVQPIMQTFDAWGCIFGPGASAYSFTLGNPTALRSGTSPLVQNIPGLPAAYNTRLLDMTIPPGVSGVYTVAVELVPAGLDPVIPIKGYASVKTVTVP
ncbi:MAG: hypothetical protein WCP22_08100 [Chlamydiota bacterium]